LIAATSGGPQTAGCEPPEGDGLRKVSASMHRCSGDIRKIMDACRESLRGSTSQRNILREATAALHGEETSAGLEVLSGDMVDVE